MLVLRQVCYLYGLLPQIELWKPIVSGGLGGTGWSQDYVNFGRGAPGLRNIRFCQKSRFLAFIFLNANIS